MKVLIDAETKRILGAAILGIGGDEIIHSVLDIMYADVPYTVIQRAVHIHPTVTELIPTTLGELKPLELAARHGQQWWRLSAEQLDELCRHDPSRPRIVILNYPSNPTGGTYSVEELEAIAEVARKYRLIVLSDEIYGKLHHDGKHRSIALMYPEGTIFSGGLSKWCGAGGWRIGVFVFPDGLRWLLDAMAAVASETFTSTSAPIQFAAVRAFEEGPEIETYLDRSRRILKALGQRLAGKLEQEGVQVASPEGGFYLFPDFRAKAEQLKARGITTSADLCNRLLHDAGVAILPGSDFCRPPEELNARLAYVNFDGGRSLDAVAKLPEGAPLDDEFLRAHCGESLEAVDLLCEWLQRPEPTDNGAIGGG